MLHFCILFYANYTILANQRGGHGPMPPLNTPLSWAVKQRFDCAYKTLYTIYQRWSPRGQILKSLALASKVKSLALASRPQVLENWPVLGSRTAVFFELLKFCEALEKFLENVFLWRSLEKFL